MPTVAFIIASLISTDPELLIPISPSTTVSSNTNFDEFEGVFIAIFLLFITDPFNITSPKCASIPLTSESISVPLIVAFPPYIVIPTVPAILPPVIFKVPVLTITCVVSDIISIPSISKLPAFVIGCVYETLVESYSILDSPSVSIIFNTLPLSIAPVNVFPAKSSVIAASVALLTISSLISLSNLTVPSLKL